MGSASLGLRTRPDLTTMQSNSTSPVSFSLHHSADLGGDVVIDREAFAVLESLADEDDPDLVKEIIELFLDDSAMRIAQIENSSDDVDAIRAQAHALKSASANVGALCFSSTCAEIESAAISDAGAGLMELVSSALEMYADVRSALIGDLAADA